MIYFGTDGIRGVANKELTVELCYKCGLAITKVIKEPKIIIATDTRESRDLIKTSLLSGLLSGGAYVVDVGIAPTSMVSFLLTKLKFDFGIVISASHNPSEYNGIKIFDKFGQKLSDKIEEEIEYHIINTNSNLNGKIGTYRKDEKLQKEYINYIIENVDVRFNDLKIVLDLANGASFKVAPIIFKKLGAKVITINNYSNGEINENCGSLHIDGLRKKVLLEKADVGFAFDGDADRLMCIDNFGNIVDGDKAIFLLANYLKKKKQLKNNIVVGTTQTNLKIEDRLKNKGIKFLRSDVGDKYVIEKMKEYKSNLGGEQSGHIILSDILPTGDGILSAVKILEVIKQEKKSLYKLTQIKLMPQKSINVIVKDKARIKNSEELNDLIKSLQKNFDGRIIVRASGTENKIRVLVEGKSKKLLNEISGKIVNLINKLNI
ncbi:MAG: phosphoglucosamine mutase [Clostridiales bacterium]|nr:phosphoglucosamine mutase [Clostridiales bacterium]